MSEIVPELRFKYFNKGWYPRKFGDLLTEVKRPIKMEDELQYQLVTVKRRNNGVVSRGQFKGKEVLVKNYYELKTGDYLISKRQVVHGANGIVPASLDGAVVSNEYLVSIGNSNITTDFLTILSKLPQMYEMFFLSSYGIDIEKLVFNVEDWKKRKVNIPLIDEQKKISAFFNVLDKNIDLHQHALDLLKQRKKAFLQKMFPKKGESVPEVRFQGFTKQWKSKKLRDMGTTKSGTGFPEKEQGGTSGIPFYKISDMNTLGNERVMKISNNYVSEEQIKNNKWKPINKIPAIIFAKVGAAIMLNRKRLVTDPFLIDNNTMAYLFGHKLNTNFAIVLFDTIFLPKYTQVGALPSYNSSDIETIDVLVPSMEEQEKIGNFFKELDNSITLQEEKLESLKQMKKAFLQKMFV